MLIDACGKSFFGYKTTSCNRIARYVEQNIIFIHFYGGEFSSSCIRNMSISTVFEEVIIYVLAANESNAIS